MSTKPTSAASGAIGWAVGEASGPIVKQSNQVFGEGTNLYNTGTSTLGRYGNLLEGLLDPNSPEGMEVIAALTAQNTALEQGANASIESQGRSGAQAYELAKVTQSGITNLGNALSQGYMQAIKELGQLGEFQTATGLTGQEAGITGEATAAGINLGAGGEYLQSAPIVAAQDAASLSNIEGIAQMVAKAFGG